MEIWPQYQEGVAAVKGYQGTCNMQNTAVQLGWGLVNRTIVP